ncbi:hypothetical protein HDV63DRAFT_407051 [Trichoderma sp. SZMC 28014]
MSPSYDLGGIPSPIKERLEACKWGLRAPSFRKDEVEEALNQAAMASMLAMDIERRVRFYKAECYRRLGEWKMALGLYERCKVDAEDRWWVEEMKSVCKVELENAARRELENAARRELEKAPRRRQRKAKQR